MGILWAYYNPGNCIFIKDSRNNTVQLIFEFIFLLNVLHLFIDNNGPKIYDLVAPDRLMATPWGSTVMFLCQALENGVSMWPKLEGRFPQVSKAHILILISIKASSSITLTQLRRQFKCIVQEQENRIGIIIAGQQDEICLGTNTLCNLDKFG